MQISEIYNKLHNSIQSYKHDNWFHFNTEIRSETYKGFFKTSTQITIEDLEHLDVIIYQLNQQLYTELINHIYTKINPITYLYTSNYINVHNQISKYNFCFCSQSNVQNLDKFIYLRNPTTQPIRLKYLVSNKNLEDIDIYLIDSNASNFKLKIGYKITENQFNYQIESSAALFIYDLNAIKLYID
jgi:hypothetical protein